MRFAVPEATTAAPVHHNPNQPIVGKCTNLEKAYFRLTTAPNENDIRPEDILKKAFLRLKTIWKETKDSNYVLDQLKAIRQDLVVQGISNEFTVEVYEYNAKIALKAQNLNEFNQCQSMLGSLYTTIPSKRQIRFLAYHIVYDVVTVASPPPRHTQNNVVEIHRHIQQAQAVLSEPLIHHALLVVEAYRTSNYPYFMVLYEAAPKGTKELMESMVTVVRNRLLKLYLSATLPSISVNQLAGLLRIEESELKKMLDERGIVYTDRIEIAKNKASIMQLPY
ncbi:hypothetical protein BLSTO_02934 [Blastocystis sp. subtype 1]